MFKDGTLKVSQVGCLEGVSPIIAVGQKLVGAAYSTLPLRKVKVPESGVLVVRQNANYRVELETKWVEFEEQTEIEVAAFLKRGPIDRGVITELLLEALREACYSKVKLWMLPKLSDPRVELATLLIKMPHKVLLPMDSEREVVLASIKVEVMLALWWKEGCE